MSVVYLFSELSILWTAVYTYSTELRAVKQQVLHKGVTQKIFEHFRLDWLFSVLSARLQTEREYLNDNLKWFIEKKIFQRVWFI